MNKTLLFVLSTSIRNVRYTSVLSEVFVVVSAHTTGIPASGTALGWAIGNYSSAAVANTVRIDTLRIWSDDPATSGDAGGNGGGQLQAITSSMQNGLDYSANIADSDKLEGLTDATVPLTVDAADGSQTDTFFGRFFKRVAAWLGTATNGLTKLFAHEVQTDRLCVGATCVTESELQQILNQQGRASPAAALPPQNPATTTATSTTPTTATTTEPTTPTVPTTPTSTPTEPTTSSPTEPTTPTPPPPAPSESTGTNTGGSDTITTSN
jgi:hypothetical protein